MWQIFFHFVLLLNKTGKSLQMSMQISPASGIPKSFNDATDKHERYFFGEYPNDEETAG